MRKLKPEEVVERARREGVTLSVATLATWRTRRPDLLPVTKIAGRCYYTEAAVAKFLHSDDGAEAAR